MIDICWESHIHWKLRALIERNKVISGKTQNHSLPKQNKDLKDFILFLLARYAYQYVTNFIHILNNQPEPKISNTNHIKNTNLKVLQNKTKSRFFSLWPNRPNQNQKKKKSELIFVCAGERDYLGGIDERRGSEKIENTESDFLLFQESRRRIRQRCWLGENPSSFDHWRRWWWWSKSSDTSSNGLHFFALSPIHSPSSHTHRVLGMISSLAKTLRFRLNGFWSLRVDSLLVLYLRLCCKSFRKKGNHFEFFCRSFFFFYHFCLIQSK